MSKTKVSYQNLTLTATIKEAEEGGFYAYCASLPGCTSEGNTYTETVANIEEAIKGYVESMIANNDPLPVEVQNPNYTIEVPLSVPTQNIKFA